jgi:hypothetical protein
MENDSSYWLPERFQGGRGNEVSSCVREVIQENDCQFG